MRQDLELPADFPPTRARARASSVTARRGHAVRPRRSRSRSSSAAVTFKYTTNTNLGDSPDAITRVPAPHHAPGSASSSRRRSRRWRARSACPARVAVGYQPGTLERRRPVPRHEPQRARLARGVDRGRGVDPVRADTRVLGADARHRHRRARRRSPTIATPGTTATTASTPDVGRRRADARARPRQPRAGADPARRSRPTHHGVRNAVTAVAIALGAVALGVLGFFAIVSFALWRRGRRRRRDHDPRRRVLGAWAEALDQLRIAGVPPRPSATALEFALRYAPAHGAGDAGPALMELARLQSAAMFAPRGAVVGRGDVRVGAGRHDPHRDPSQRRALRPVAPHPDETPDRDLTRQRRRLRCPSR